MATKNEDDLRSATNIASDSQAPLILKTDPIKNAQNIDYEFYNFYLFFNEEIKKGESGKIKFIANGHTFESSLDDVSIWNYGSTHRASLSFGRNTGYGDVWLKPNTQYIVNVDPGTFKDTSDNDFIGINDSGTLSFTTKADTTKPTLQLVNNEIWSTPKDNATQVSVGLERLKITFEEEIIRGTGDIILVSESGGRSTFAVDDGKKVSLNTDWRDNRSELTVSLPNPLEKSEKYYVLIDNGAFKDSSGNIFSGITDPTIWNFETQAEDLPADKTTSAVIQYTHSKDHANNRLSSNLSAGPDRKDWIKVKIDQERTYTIEIKGALNNGNLQLLDNNGNVIQTKTEKITKRLGQGTYFIEVDADFGRTGQYTVVVSANTDQPKLSTSHPRKEEVAYDPNNQIELHFTTEIKEGSGNIVISDGGSDLRSINVADATQVIVRNNTVFVKPRKPLKADTAYSIELDKGAFKDQNQNDSPALKDTSSIKFTTGATNSSAPTVSHIIGLHNGNEKNPNYSEIAIHYDKVISRKTADKTAFTIKTDGQINPIEDMRVLDDVIYLTPTHPIKTDKNTIVSYKDVSSDNDKTTVQDLSGRDANSFTDENVLNEVLYAIKANKIIEIPTKASAKDDNFSGYRIDQYLQPTERHVYKFKYNGSFNDEIEFASKNGIDNPNSFFNNHATKVLIYNENGELQDTGEYITSASYNWLQQGKTYYAVISWPKSQQSDEAIYQHATSQPNQSNTISEPYFVLPESRLYELLPEDMFSNERGYRSADSTKWAERDHDINDKESAPNIGLLNNANLIWPSGKRRHILSVNGSDMFKFAIGGTGTENDYIQLNKGDHDFKAEINLILYDQSGNEVRKEQNAGKLSLNKIKAGTYYIRVVRENTNNASGYYDLTFKTPKVSITEVDEDQSSPISLGIIMAGSNKKGLAINSSTDVDTIRFEKIDDTTAGGVTLNYDVGIADLDLAIHPKGENSPIYAAKSITNQEYISLGDLPAATYDLKINSSNHQPAAYTIDFSPIASKSVADRYEKQHLNFDNEQADANNVINNAFNIGSIEGTKKLIDMSIDSSTDLDHYYIRQEINKKTEINLIFDHAKGDLDLELYKFRGKEDKPVLLGKASSGTDNEKLTIPYDKNQTNIGFYAIKVYGKSGATNTYSIETKQVRNKIKKDSYEHNDNRESTNSIRISPDRRWNSQLTLHSGDDIDNYKFKLTDKPDAQDYLYINAEIKFDSSDKLKASLYENDGKTLISNSFDWEKTYKGWRDTKINRHVIPLADLETEKEYVLKVEPNKNKSLKEYAIGFSDKAPIKTLQIDDKYDTDGNNNDTTSNAKDLGTISNLTKIKDLTLTTKNDIDWFKFKVSQKTRADQSALKLFSPRTGGTIGMTLYDGNPNDQMCSSNQDRLDLLPPGDDKCKGDPPPPAQKIAESDFKDYTDRNESIYALYGLLKNESNITKLPALVPGKTYYLKFDNQSCWNCQSSNYHSHGGFSTDYEFSLQLPPSRLKTQAELLPIKDKNEGVDGNGNDKPSNPTDLGSINADKTYSGLTFHHNDDIDIYKFSLDEDTHMNDRLHVYRKGQPNGMQLEYEIWDQYYNQIMPSNWYGSASFNELNKGNYGLVIRAEKNILYPEYFTNVPDNFGEYIIDFQPADTVDKNTGERTPDKHEGSGGNDSASTATKLSSVALDQGRAYIEGTLHKRMDADWYEISVADQQPLSWPLVTMYSRLEDGNIDLFLYNETGTELLGQSIDRFPTGKEVLNGEGIKPGKYKIKVVGHRLHQFETSIKEFGDYQLAVTPYISTPYPKDKFESNDVLLHAPDLKNRAADLGPINGKIVHKDLNLELNANTGIKDGKFERTPIEFGSDTYIFRLDQHADDGDYIEVITDGPNKLHFEVIRLDRLWSQEGWKRYFDAFTKNNSVGYTKSSSTSYSEYEWGGQDRQGLQRLYMAGFAAGDYALKIKSLANTRGKYELHLDGPPLKNTGDRYEANQSNDTVANAVKLNQKTEAIVVNDLSIHYKYDVDYFKINLSETGNSNHYISAESLGTLADNGNLTLSLIDQWGKEYGEDYNANFWSELTGIDGETTRSYLDLEGVPAGDYTIKVDTGYGVTFGGFRRQKTGNNIKKITEEFIKINYQLAGNLPTEASKQDFFEKLEGSNNTAPVGRISSIKRYENHSLHDISDIDLLRFEINRTATATDGAGIRFKHGDYGQGNLKLELIHGGTGQTLATSDHSTSRQNTEWISLEDRNPGEYELKITGISDATGHYSLDIMPPGRRIRPDGYEGNTGNDLITNPKVLTGLGYKPIIKNLTIDDALDVDYYKFSTKYRSSSRFQNTKHYVGINFWHGSGNLDLELYSPDGKELLGYSYDFDNDEKIELIDLPAGDYILKVLGRNSASNQYDLDFKLPSFDSLTQDALNNHTKEKAYQFKENKQHELLGGIGLQPVTGTLDQSNKEDWYRYKFLKNQHYDSGPTVEYDFKSAKINVEVYRKIPGISELEWLAHMKTGKGRENISMDDWGSGEYYFRVFSDSIKSITEYELDVKTGWEAFDGHEFFPQQASEPQGDVYDDANTNDDYRYPYKLSNFNGSGEFEGYNLLREPAIFSQTGFDQDWYELDLRKKGGENDYIKAIFKQWDVDLDLYLLDKNSQAFKDAVIDYNDIKSKYFKKVDHLLASATKQSISYSDDEYISLKDLPRSTYLLYAHGFDMWNPSTRYQLEFNTPQLSYQADNYEPNNTPNTAYSLGKFSGRKNLIELSLDNKNDKDYISFETQYLGTAKDHITLNYFTETKEEAGKSIPNGDNIKFQLLDKDKKIVQSTKSTQTLTGSSLSLEGLAAGQYTIEIEPEIERKINYDINIELPTDPSRKAAWTWLYYLPGYLDIDVKTTIEELEEQRNKLPSSVNLVVMWDQIDKNLVGERFKAQVKNHPTGAGQQAAWSGVGRAIIKGDDTHQYLTSDFEVLPEADMGDADNLGNFIKWANKVAPADNMGLTIHGHSSGLGAIVGDIESGGTNLQIKDVANQLKMLSADETPINIDVVRMDGCLTGTMELAYEIRNNTDFTIGSEEISSTGSGRYATNLGSLRNYPYEVKAKELTSWMIDEYSTSHGTRHWGTSKDTQSAVETKHLESLAAAISKFVDATKNATTTERLWLEVRRSFAPFYGGGDYTRDIGQFMVGVAKCSNIGTPIRTAARDVVAALENTVSSKSNDRRGSGGLSIYYPNITLKSQGYELNGSYKNSHSDFIKDTQWDEYIKAQGMVDWSSLLYSSQRPRSESNNDTLASDSLDQNTRNYLENNNSNQKSIEQLVPIVHNWAPGNSSPSTAHSLGLLSGSNIQFDQLPIDENSKQYFRFNLAGQGTEDHRIELTSTIASTKNISLALLTPDGTNKANDSNQIIGLNNLAAGEYILEIQNSGTPIAQSSLTFSLPKDKTPTSNKNDNPEKPTDLGIIAAPRLITSLTQSASDLANGSWNYFEWGTSELSSRGPQKFNTRINVADGIEYEAQIVDLDKTVIDTVTGSGQTNLTFTASGSGERYILKIRERKISDTTRQYADGSSRRKSSFSVLFTPGESREPNLISSIPADNATGVAIDGNIELNFEKEIKPGNGSVIITGTNANRKVIPINNSQVKFSNKGLTINPTSNLKPDKNYHIEITPGAILDKKTNVAYPGIRSHNKLNFKTSDNIPPQLLSSSPKTLSTEVGIDSDIIFRFNESIQKGNGQIVITDGISEANTQRINVSSPQVTINGSVATINPDNNLKNNTYYYVWLPHGAFKDESGNKHTGMTEQNALQFQTVDQSPPKLKISDPLDNATSVATSSNILLTFDEPIKAGTGNVIISDGSTELKIPISSEQITFSNNTITINPSNDLASNTSYHIKIEKGAITDHLDIAHPGINDKTTLNFTTADVDKPLLASTSPADNSSSVAANSKIVFTFNEKIKAGKGTILISDGASDLRNIDITSSEVEIDNKSLTITPAAPLQESSDYHIKIASGVIQDIAGNPYAGISNTTSFNFKTGDATAPTIVSTSPFDNSKDNNKSANIKIEFSEPIVLGDGYITFNDGSSDTHKIQASDSTQVSINNAKTLVINPSADLASDTNYSIKIDNKAVKDKAGNAFAGISDATTFNFHIADTDKPRLNSSTPVDDSYGFDEGDNIVLSFNENIQLSGNGHIRLHAAFDDSIIPSSASVNGKTLTINPSPTLQSESSYYLKISHNAITDQASTPNTFAGITDKTSLNFTTAQYGSLQGSGLKSNTDTRLDQHPSVQLLVTPLEQGGAIEFTPTTDQGIWFYNYNDPSPLQIKSAGKDLYDSLISDSHPITNAMPSPDLASLWDQKVEDQRASIVHPTDQKIFKRTGYTLPQEQNLNRSSLNQAIRWVFDRDGYVRVYSKNENSQELTLKATSSQQFTASQGKNSYFYPAFAAVKKSNNTVAAGSVPTDIHRLVDTGKAQISLVGTPVVGQKLTLQLDGEDPEGSPNLLRDGSIQWLRNGNPITGATADTYTLTNADLNKAIKAQISYTDTEGFTETAPSSNSFTIKSSDQTGPKLLSSEPADNAVNISNRSTIKLNFDEPIQADAGSIELDNQNGDARSISIVDSNRININGNTLTLNLAQPLATDSSYHIKISRGAFTDTHDNPYAGITNKTSLNFTTIETVPPRLKTFSPSKGADNIPVASEIKLTFTEAIKAGQGKITLTDGDADVRQINITDKTQISISDKVLKIKPTADLNSSTSYSLQIPQTAVLDLVGNPFSGISDQTTIQFTTQDILPPTLKSTTPADDQTDVLINQQIILEFNESIKIGSGKLLITDQGNDHREIIVNSNQISIDDTQLIITPSQDLLENRSYSLLHEPGAITDQAGNPFAGISDFTTFNFSTADLTAPDLTARSPGKGSTDVSVNSPIKLFFDENIKAGKGTLTLSDGQQDKRKIKITNSDVINITDNILTITPKNQFLSTSTYTLNLPDGFVTDHSSNDFNGLSTSFETEDADPPILLSTTPVNNGKLDIKQNVVLTFNEPVLAGTGSILLKDKANNQTIETLQANSSRVSYAGNTVNIDFKNNLVNRKAYKLDFTASNIFKDKSGNQFKASGDNLIHFTAESVADTISTKDKIGDRFAINPDNSMVTIFVDGNTSAKVKPLLGARNRLAESSWKDTEQGISGSFAVEAVEGFKEKGKDFYAVAIKETFTENNKASEEWYKYIFNNSGTFEYSVEILSLAQVEEEFKQDLNKDNYIGVNPGQLKIIRKGETGYAAFKDQNNNIYILDENRANSPLLITESWGEPAQLIDSWDGGSRSIHAVEQLPDGSFIIAIQTRDSHSPNSTKWETAKLSVAAVVDSNSFQYGDIASQEKLFKEDLNFDNTIGFKADALTTKSDDTTGDKLALNKNNELFILSQAGATVPVKDEFGPARFDESETFPGGSFKRQSRQVQLWDNGTSSDTSDDVYLLAVYEQSTHSFEGGSDSHDSWIVYSIDQNGNILWNQTAYNVPIADYELRFDADLDGDTNKGFNLNSLQLISTDTVTPDSSPSGVTLKRDNKGNRLFIWDGSNNIKILDSHGQTPQLEFSSSWEGGTFKAEAFAVEQRNTTPTTFSLAIKFSDTSSGSGGGDGGGNGGGGNGGGGPTTVNNNGSDLSSGDDGNSGSVMWEIHTLTYKDINGDSSKEAVLDWSTPPTFTPSIASYEKVFKQDLNGDSQIGLNISKLSTLATDKQGHTAKLSKEGAIFLFDGSNNSSLLALKDPNGGSPSFSVNHSWDTGNFQLTPFAVSDKQNNGTASDSSDDYYLLAIKQQESTTLEDKSTDTNVKWELHQVNANTGVFNFDDSVFTRSILKYESIFKQDLNGDGKTHTGSIQLTSRNTDTHNILLKEDDAKSLYIVDGSTKLEIKDSFIEQSSRWADGSYKSKAIAVERNNNQTPSNSSDDYYQLAVRQTNTFKDNDGNKQTDTNWQIYAINQSGEINWEKNVWTQSISSFENFFHQDLDGSGKKGDIPGLKFLSTDTKGHRLQKDAKKLLYITNNNGNNRISITESGGSPVSFDHSYSWGTGSSTSKAVAVERNPDKSFSLAVQVTSTEKDAAGTTNTDSHWELYSINKQGIVDYDNVIFKDDISAEESKLFKEDIDQSGSTGLNFSSLQSVASDSYGDLLKRDSNGFFYILSDADTTSDTSDDEHIPLSQAWGDRVNFNTTDSFSGGSFSSQAVAIESTSYTNSKGISTNGYVIALKNTNTTPSSTNIDWELRYANADGVLDPDLIVSLASIQGSESLFGTNKNNADLDGDNKFGIDTSALTTIATDTSGDGLQKDSNKALFIVDDNDSVDTSDDNRIPIKESSGETAIFNYTYTDSFGNQTRTVTSEAVAVESKQVGGKDCFQLAVKITESTASASSNKQRSNSQQQSTTFWETWLISKAGILDPASGSRSKGIRRKEADFNQDLNGKGGIESATSVSTTAFSSDTTGAVLAQDSEESLYIKDSGRTIAIVDDNDGPIALAYTESSLDETITVTPFAVEKNDNQTPSNASDDYYKLATKHHIQPKSGKAFTLWQTNKISLSGVLSFASETFGDANIHETDLKQDLDGDSSIWSTANATFNAVNSDTRGAAPYLDSNNNLYIQPAGGSTKHAVVDAAGALLNFEHSWTVNSKSYKAEVFAVSNKFDNGTASDSSDDYYKLLIKETETDGGNETLRYETYNIAANTYTLDWATSARFFSAFALESAFQLDIDGNGSIATIDANSTTAIATDTAGARLRQSSNGFLFIKEGASTNPIKGPDGGYVDLNVKESYDKDTSFQSEALAISNKFDNGTTGKTSDDYYKLAVRETNTYKGESDVIYRIITLDSKRIIQPELDQFYTTAELNEKTFAQDITGDSNISAGQSTSANDDDVKVGTTDGAVLKQFGNTAQSKIVSIANSQSDSSDKNIEMFVGGVQGSAKTNYDVAVKVVQKATAPLLAKATKTAGVDDASKEVKSITGLLDFNVTIPDSKNHGKIVNLSWVLPKGTKEPVYLKEDSLTKSFFNFTYNPSTGEGAKWDASNNTLTVHVRDNGKYDDNPTPGIVEDPALIVDTNAKRPSPTPAPSPGPSPSPRPSPSPDPSPSPGPSPSPFPKPTKKPTKPQRPIKPGKKPTKHPLPTKPAKPTKHPLPVQPDKPAKPDQPTTKTDPTPPPTKTTTPPTTPTPNKVTSTPTTTKAPATTTPSSALPISALISALISAPLKEAKGDLQDLTPKQFSNLQPKTLTNLRPALFQTISERQIKALSYGSVEAITPAQINELKPAAFKGFQRRQASALNPKVFSVLNIPQLAAFPPNSFSAFSARQIKKLKPRSLSALNPRQFSKLPPKTVAAFSTKQFKKLSPTLFRTLNGKQLAAFGKQDLNALSSNQLKAIQPDSIDAIKPNLLNSLKPDQIAAFSLRQLRAFSRRQQRRLSSAFLDALSNKQRKQLQFIDSDPITNNNNKNNGKSNTNDNSGNDSLTSSNNKPNKKDNKQDNKQSRLIHHDILSSDNNLNPSLHNTTPSSLPYSSNNNNEFNIVDTNSLLTELM